MANNIKLLDIKPAIYKQVEFVVNLTAEDYK